MDPRIRKSILRFGGCMLMALGILHLAVTPFISQLIADNVTEAVAVRLTPPMLLNHVAVGILLLPLGFMTFYAAPSAVAGEKWAVIITRVLAVTIAALPVVLFMLMSTRYFGAIPFIVATAIVCIAALALLAAAFGPKNPPAA